MIWFDITELERKLKNGGISDKETFNYLIANLIMFSLGPYASSNGYQHKWLIALEILLVIIITIIGTKRTFDINTTGDNVDYFKRFLSLSFTTGIKLAIGLIIFGIIAAVPLILIVGLADINIGANENVTDLLRLALTTIIGIFYYFMLTNSFKRVSH